MKIIYGILFLLLPTATQAAKNQEIQILARGNYDIANFALSSLSDASYTGIGYGADIVSKYSNGRYGLGLTAGYSTIDLENTANTSRESEMLSGAVVNVGTRFYALDLYLGLGIVYRSFTADYELNSVSTKTDYSGLGLRIEAGIDLPLGQTILVAPKVQYDIQNVSPKSGTASSKRFTDFGLSLGLGFSF